jgi:hypothetical protein
MGKHKPYEMLGTPEAGCGTRIVPLQEVAQLLANNSTLREAVERIDRFEGCHRLAEKVIHEDYSRNINTIRNNAFQIKSQLNKAKAA